MLLLLLLMVLRLLLLVLRRIEVRCSTAKTEHSLAVRASDKSCLIRIPQRLRLSMLLLGDRGAAVNQAGIARV